MRLATFNCNSIRKRLPIVLEWLAKHDPDLLALQETKCRDEDFPVDPFRQAGRHVVFRGEKSYNGVAMITRETPTRTTFGLGDDDGESETRFARIDLNDIHILNAYVPQGQDLESPKFQFKLQWLRRVRDYLENHFDPGRDKVVWLGDLNVAPTPDDVHSPKTIWPHVCFCQPVIDAFQAVTDWGLTDVFRKHLPDAGTFTFWDYRIRGGVKRNAGWRIDHVQATSTMAGTSTNCCVDIEPRLMDSPSDHTFVYADFEV